MRRALVTVLLVSLFAVGVIADTVSYRHTFSTPTEIPQAVGTWLVKSGRVYQTDESERLAKINVMAEQSGEMQYSFDVRYEGGGFDDLMGGFGLQIFVDTPYMGRSWGNGNSYLLWLNYDDEATYGSTGFQAQVYKSTSPTKMELVGEFNLNRFAIYLSSQHAGYKIPVRIKVDGTSGSVWVVDPTLAGFGYRLELGEPLADASYVALRTNSLALSFDNLEVKKLD